MKSPEAVLAQQITGNAGLAALVGTRVYPVLAPATASLPFVTWRRSGIQRSQTLGAPMGLPRVSVEYGIYGTTYEQARDVADRMRAVLDGYGGTVLGCTVQQVSLENESDDFVTLAGTDLPPVYQITQVFDIWWNEES